MTVGMPVLIAAAYALALFACAAWAHNRQAQLAQSPLRIHAYTLALAVYCSSWTYFGAVGTAAIDGWNYLPIYLGPILLFLLAPRLLHRLTHAVHTEGATSISDFIGSRFGKSRGVAALVTILALFGTIPYLALQLRSVGISYSILSGEDGIASPILLAAVGFALFAMIFGTRRYDVAARNETVLFVAGAESLLKLFALCCVALFSIAVLMDAPAPLRVAGLERLGHNFSPSNLSLDFFAVSLLSMMAILCLPRQFYIGVMAAHEADDTMRARWPFIGYLSLTVIAAIPIALAGLTLMGPESPADFFVLSLPMAYGANILTLLVFIGGLSAAVAMVVTETIALSTMISNDLIAPFLIQSRATEDGNLGRILLRIRRAAIALLMTAAAIYALLIPANAQLASLGLVAFVALAQSAPVLLIAIFRSSNDPLAAKAGLSVGFLFWFYTLFLPVVGGAPMLSALTGTLADPRALLGVTSLSPIVHGMLWSLGGNLLAFALVAARRFGKIDFAARRQRGIAQIATLGALADMVERFVGADAMSSLIDMDRAAPIDQASARQAERLIASVVGASSARAIMAAALSGESLDLDDITMMLDASGQSLRFSQGLLAATLENIDPGVSVIDRNLRLVAWNRRYLELFQYPRAMVRVGAPVSDLIRFNAERGECGPGEVEDHVARRLAHMRSGHPHSFERHRHDGRVVKTVGGPMPDGGYVMSFTDITAEAQARAALENARAELENRVAARTAELSEANEKLAGAIVDKTRFLAAASHDLLQPLHAARLFSAALKRDTPQAGLQTLDRLDRSIGAANDLLGALLDISKLDAGGVVPQPTRFAVRPMLAEMVENFEPLAQEGSLRLSLGAGNAVIEADRTLLRSILQNFISNAIRYTDCGGVVVGVRRRAGMVRIEVWDSGPGIGTDQQALIFREFERLGTSKETGIGLGLAIVERTAPLVGGQIDLYSRPGYGSCFAIILQPSAAPMMPHPPVAERRIYAVRRQKLLVVDDDPNVCEAMAALLVSRGHDVVTAQSANEALAEEGTFDAALVDFHLGEGMDGIALIDQLVAHQTSLRAALVTADQSADMMERAKTRRLNVLSKPLAAGRLEEWLAEKGQVSA